jgi:hypothetical protein
MRDFCTKDLALGSIFQEKNNAFYVRVVVHTNFLESQLTPPLASFPSCREESRVG